MVELKEKMKLICSSFSRKTSPQTLWIRLPPEFKQFFNPHLLITNLKREEAQRAKHSIIPRVFLHVLVHVSTVYWNGSEGHPLLLGLMLEKFLEITTTTLLKMNFTV